MKLLAGGVVFLLALSGQSFAAPKAKPLDANYCVDRCRTYHGPGSRNDYSYCVSRCSVWLAERQAKSVTPAQREASNTRSASPRRREQPAQDTQDFRAIYKRFLQFTADGNYGAALIEAQKLEAAVKARLGSTHRDYANALRNLAFTYYHLGRNAEAEGHYRGALAIREKANGANHPDVAIILLDLGQIAGSKSQYAEAEGHFKRALGILEKAKGCEPPGFGAAPYRPIHHICE